MKAAVRLAAPRSFAVRSSLAGGVRNGTSKSSRSAAAAAAATTTTARPPLGEAASLAMRSNPPMTSLPTRTLSSSSSKTVPSGNTSGNSTDIVRTPDEEESTHLPALPIDFDASSSVSGQESQILEVDLEPQQVLRAESGAMLYMTSGVEMNTTLAEGGISSGLKRMLTGQNMFLADYTYSGEDGTRGTVALGTDFPSKILRLSLEEYGGKIVCQKGAYLAGSHTVDIQMEFAKKFTAGFFGGEGFVLQSLEGSGDVFVKAGGTLVKRDLKEGETLRVSSGCLVAFTQTVNFDVTTMPGFKNVMFGGEGLFVTTLTGPGTVWLQGMPPDRMISEIARRVPSGGGIGLGVPLGVGGGSGGAEEGEGADAAAAGAAADEAAAGEEGGGGAEDMVAATDAAVDADRQATVASSGMGGEQEIDAESPSALFGDAAPADDAAASSSSSSSATPGFDESTSFSTDDASSADFGEDVTGQQFDDFADDTQFSTMDEPKEEDFGGSEEEFDTGDYGGGDDGGDDGESLIKQIWDFFTSDD